MARLLATVLAVGVCGRVVGVMWVMWDIDLVRGGDVEMVVTVDLVLKHSQLDIHICQI